MKPARPMKPMAPMRSLSGGAGRCSCGATAYRRCQVGAEEKPLCRPCMRLLADQLRRFLARDSIAGARADGVVRDDATELDPEASARLRELMDQPHDPAAALVNLTRAQESLRQRRSAS